ncbi:MAG: glycoside hydrolase family 16 protein [Bacteroidetes bacterium]|nr:glycoside hydrolase family 16 protein [Bacteroidota bacterium]
MRYIIPTVVALFLLAAPDSRAQTPAVHRNLVWSDEFNYKGLPDSTKWSYGVGGHGWGNHQLEYYTARRPENARVEDGKLIIEARKESWEGSGYTSARLMTKGKGDWQYGRIEVRAKLPKGRGTWPAIWMLGSVAQFRWPDDGEIDIMEHVGYNQGCIHGTIHCKAYNHRLHTQKGDTIRVNDCSENFHVYAMEWTKDSINISVDDSVYFSFAHERAAIKNSNGGAVSGNTGNVMSGPGSADYAEWPFDNKMHLLLNLAVGGDWGGQKGVDEGIWPQRMEVDYVRVYK